MESKEVNLIFRRSQKRFLAPKSILNKLCKSLFSLKKQHWIYRIIKCKPNLQKTPINAQYELYQIFISLNTHALSYYQKTSKTVIINGIITFPFHMCTYSWAARYNQMVCMTYNKYINALAKKKKNGKKRRK